MYWKHWFNQIQVQILTSVRTLIAAIYNSSWKKFTALDPLDVSAGHNSNAFMRIAVSLKFRETVLHGYVTTTWSEMSKLGGSTIFIRDNWANPQIHRYFSQAGCENYELVNSECFRMQSVKLSFAWFVAECIRKKICWAVGSQSTKFSASFNRRRLVSLQGMIMCKLLDQEISALPDQDTLNN